MNRRTGERRALTAVELMVATVILAVGLVPILTLQQSTGRQAGFTFAHAAVQLRAMTVLSRVAALGIDELRERDRTGRPLVTPAGAARGGEDEWLGVGTAGTGTGPATAFVDVIRETISFDEVGPGLGVVWVEVAWRWGSPASVHRIRCFRVVARPDDSWSRSAPLQLEPDRIEVD